MAENWSEEYNISGTRDRIQIALDIAWRYAQNDGAWHKTWTIDQMVRVLCGSEEEYDAWVAEYEKPFLNKELNCMDHYDWDTGIAP